MSEAAPIVPFANLDQPPPILAVPPTTSSRSLYVVLVFGAIMVSRATLRANPFHSGPRNPQSAALCPFVRPVCSLVGPAQGEGI